jgi:hypothetical protein
MPLSSYFNQSGVMAKNTNDKEQDMKLSRRERLNDRLSEQRRWIEQCGGDLAGYIARCNPSQSIENVKAIYDADMTELARIERELLACR